MPQLLFLAISHLNYLAFNEIDLTFSEVVFVNDAGGVLQDVESLGFADVVSRCAMIKLAIS